MRKLCHLVICLVHTLTENCQKNREPSAYMIEIIISGKFCIYKLGFFPNYEHFYGKSKKGGWPITSCRDKSGSVLLIQRATFYLVFWGNFFFSFPQNCQNIFFSSKVPKYFFHPRFNLMFYRIYTPFFVSKRARIFFKKYFIYIFFKNIFF